jgi:hypothetical protein
LMVVFLVCRLFVCFVVLLVVWLVPWFDSRFVNWPID